MWIDHPPTTPSLQERTSAMEDLSSPLRRGLICRRQHRAPIEEWVIGSEAPYLRPVTFRAHQARVVGCAKGAVHAVLQLLPEPLL